jgi:hypothetical protein
MIRNVKLLSFIFCLLVANVVNAQTTDINSAGQTAFTLFEGIESNEPRHDSPSIRPTRESRVTAAEPEFTLVGTSRIGDSYSAILKHRSGDNVVVRSGPGSTTPVTGYPDYLISDVGAGNLSLRYPVGTPCEDHLEQGVSCTNIANTARLELVNGEALAVQRTLNNVEGSAEQGEAVPAGINPETGEPINPFEAIRAARAAGINPSDAAAAANGRPRFTPRRIADEDVPPGMRKVSTPFGDRLVEE